MEVLASLATKTTTVLTCVEKLADRLGGVVRRAGCTHRGGCGSVSAL